MPDPFDPKPCCIVGVCCPPGNPDSEERRVTALSSEIDKAMGAALASDVAYAAATSPRSLSRGPSTLAEMAARAVLARYDLVPKGLGAFIVNSYEPYFRDKFKKG